MTETPDTMPDGVSAATPVDPVEAAYDILRDADDPTAAVKGLTGEQLKKLTERIEASKLPKEKMDAARNAILEQMRNELSDLDEAGRATQLDELERRLDNAEAASTVPEEKKQEDKPEESPESNVAATNKEKPLGTETEDTVGGVVGAVNEQEDHWSKAFEKIAALASRLGKMVTDLQEKLAVSIGTHLGNLGEFGATVEKWIGPYRLHLVRALSAIALPLPIASFAEARRVAESVIAETNASARGWSVERTMAVFARYIKGSGVTGKEKPEALAPKIAKAGEDLRKEIEGSPVTGPALGFAPAEKPAEVKFNQMVEGQTVIVMSDGSMTVGGQKWHIESGGVRVPVGNVVFEAGKLRFVTNYQDRVIENNLGLIVADLAKPGVAGQKIAPPNGEGKSIIDFIRSPA